MTEREFLTAAFQGDLPAVQHYKEQGGNINAVNSKGMSALMLAIWNGGNDELIEYLLNSGVDYRISQESSGWRALTFAAVNGHERMLRLLLEHGDTVTSKDWKALLFAIQYRNHTTAGILLEHGADINTRDEEGRTSLMRAAKNSDPIALTLLLEHGADVNLTDNKGMTALMLAAQKANVENIRSLVEHGADIHARNASNETALQLAQLAKKQKIILELQGTITVG